MDAASAPAPPGAVSADVLLHLETPLTHSVPVSEAFQGEVFLKLDALQPSGSFKLRGIGLVRHTPAAAHHLWCTAVISIP